MPSRLPEVERLLSTGDIAGAARLAREALATGEVDPLLLNLAAWLREEAGDFGGAHALLSRAQALALDDPYVRTSIAAVLRKQHRLDEALAAIDEVVRILPDGPAGWLERGYVLEALGHGAGAADSYERAAAIDPSCAPAFAGQAAMAARRGAGAAARAHADRALAIDPANTTAHLALAEHEIETRDAAGARDRLDDLLARDDLSPLDRIRALGLRGDALDRLDAVDEAFADYSAAKRLYATVHAPAVAGQASHRDWVEALSAAFVASDPACWTGLADDPSAPAGTHVFLLGYPRSGTTLVENVLASADGVAAIEERPTLVAADRAFLTDDDGMARLAALDPAAAAALRAAYWRAVATAAGPGGRHCLVDMDPFKTLRLPVIARLFPRARILFMRRDPRDVVWSCFRQNFRLSPANYESVDLVRIARHYDAVMRFADRCRAVLPLDVLDVDYAALVRDFDATTRAVCDFAGIGWTPALRAFDRTAQQRGVTTASAGQVRTGLFDGGGQWRRYARHLAPVMPILAPWVKRYGTT